MPRESRRHILAMAALVLLRVRLAVMASERSPLSWHARVLFDSHGQGRWNWLRCRSGQHAVGRALSTTYAGSLGDDPVNPHTGVQKVRLLRPLPESHHWP